MALEKIRAGLARTRAGLLARLGTVIGARDTAGEADFESLFEALIEADAGVRTATRIVEGLKDDWRGGKLASTDFLEELEKRLVAVLGNRERGDSLPRAGTAVLLAVGVNGVGKTTSIAKLAHWYQTMGRKVVLAASDTFRAGSIEQLELWAKRLGTRVVKHSYGADPAAVAYDALKMCEASGGGVVMIDTAGRLHTKKDLMGEIRKVHDVVSRAVPGAPHEVLLVLDATVGQNGLEQAARFKEAVGLTAVFLAKLDGTARGGIVLAVEETLDTPVKWVGTGEGLEDLSEFVPAEFVRALLAR